MSKRENIAGDIITKLDAVSSPIEFKKLTREPFEVEELRKHPKVQNVSIDMESYPGSFDTRPITTLDRYSSDVKN